MKKVIIFFLAAFITGCCTPQIETRFIKTHIPIPEHGQLDALTQKEVDELDPIVKAKFENIKAVLIGNIQKLEVLIKANNND